MPKDEAYRLWIRKNYCAECGTCDGIDNMGEPYCTPAHVRTYGATGVDDENLVPLCVKCHQKWEVRPTEEKLLKWQGLAKTLWLDYQNNRDDNKTS